MILTYFSYNMTQEFETPTLMHTGALSLIWCVKFSEVPWNRDKMARSISPVLLFPGIQLEFLHEIFQTISLLFCKS
jgi:hypothetical protein